MLQTCGAFLFGVKLGFQVLSHGSEFNPVSEECYCKESK
jgi:hypothetical protein